MKIDKSRLKYVSLNSLGFPQEDGMYRFIKEIYAVVDIEKDSVLFYNNIFQANMNKNIAEMINKKIYQLEVRKLVNVFIPINSNQFCHKI
jgi:hypothetical protein